MGKYAHGVLLDYIKEGALKSNYRIPEWMNLNYPL